MGGALAAYGATGMFTSGGLRPPNPIVLAGVAFVVIVLAAMWLTERRASGIWPALLISAVPYSLYALGSLAQPECTEPYRAITPEYSCAPVGTRAIAVVAPLLAAGAAVLLARDVRALAASLRR